MEFAYKAVNNKESMHVSLLFSVLYAKCPYYVVLYMQTGDMGACDDATGRGHGAHPFAAVGLVLHAILCSDGPASLS